MLVFAAALFVFAVPPPPPSPAPAAPDGGLADGRACTSSFYAGDVATIWARFSPDMRKAIPTADALAAFRRQVEGQLGGETKLIGERVMPLPGASVYLRTASFAKVPVPIDVVWSFAPSGAIVGFYVRPQPAAAPSRRLDYQTKAKLRLPFDGEWFVFWGGRSVAENQHAATPDQRFAYDILAMKDGATHAGDGSKNEQYFAFGRPILAPASGKIVVAVDGVADNRPGEMNPKQAVGNHVVIDLGNGEFAFVAHLQRGSVAVKVGAVVKAGDRLGLCGNSGNSSEPHLHFHMQTSPTFGAGASEEGLPAQFLGYVADGKPVARGEPTRGQTIRSR